MNDKVSVIVPIYNADQWLDECIKSVLNQTYSNIELLLINDGSIDLSIDICKKYEKLDSRVKIINKLNTGVSDTRNVGIENAKGNYIVFLDSDDFLMNTIIQDALNKQKSTGNELVIWNHNLIKGKLNQKEPLFYGDKISKEELMKSVISDFKCNYNLGNYFRAVHGKLFLTSIINEYNIRFNKDSYIGEDAVFMLKYLIYVDQLSYLNTYGYNYRLLNTSAVRKFKKDLYEQSCIQLDDMKTFLKSNNLLNTSIESSFTVLAWTLFRDLLKNDIVGKDYNYLNAQKWLINKKDLLCNKNANINEFPNITKIHYKLVSYLPTKMICLLTHVYMKIK